MYSPKDYSTISFPWLGWEFDPSRIIDLGFVQIRWYGLIIAVGLMLAAIYGMRRSKQFGIKQDDIMDGFLWIVPFAVICARLYYCIFSWSAYASDPISILFIWEGGLAIYGGVIGAMIGVIIFCRVKKINTWALLDLVALGFMIGQSIGRWGNFFNREAFGSEITTDFFLRMGLYNQWTGQVQYFHPTFLYESMWNLVGFIALHFISKKRKFDGQIALSYVAWYGLGRAMIEGLRTDSLMWGPIRVSQMLAAVSCLAAVIALLYKGLFQRRKPLYVTTVDPAELEPPKKEKKASDPEETGEEANNDEGNNDEGNNDE